VKGLKFKNFEKEHWQSLCANGNRLAAPIAKKI
jgi:hypothetical protein